MTMNTALEGYRTVRAMWKYFYNEHKEQFVAPDRSSGVYGDERKVTVWLVLVAVQALADGAKLYPQELGPCLEALVAAMMKYHLPEFHGFCAAENFGGNRDIYYDDDAQVALALITAYEATGIQLYLATARECVRFLMGGWNLGDEVLKGGMLWHMEKDYVNACTTAEVAKACLQLAKHVPTEREMYVGFAAQCVDWQIRVLQDPEDKLIWDGVGQGKTDINRAKYLYNQGTTLLAACMLFEATGDAKWREMADVLAEAGMDHTKSLYDRDYWQEWKRYWQSPLYFVQLLIEGLADYHMVFGPEAKWSAKVALEIHRHLVLFRRFNHDASDGMYYIIFEPHRIDQAKYQEYRDWMGETKAFNPNGEDHEDGDCNKRMVKLLIGAGAGARCWFQGARVVSTIDENAREW